MTWSSESPSPLLRPTTPRNPVAPTFLSLRLVCFPTSTTLHSSRWHIIPLSNLDFTASSREVAPSKKKIDEVQRRVLFVGEVPQRAEEQLEIKGSGHRCFDCLAAKFPHRSETKRPGERNSNPSRHSEKRMRETKRMLQAAATKRRANCAFKHDDQNKGKGERREAAVVAKFDTKATSSEFQGRTATRQAIICQEKKPPFCVFHNRGQCRSGTNCPFVHRSKDDQSSSPTRQPKSNKIKESNRIAKDKAGGNSLQVPRMEKIHAEGNLKRHEATGPPKSVHWSAHDMKVAHIQEAHPSRNVTQKRN